MGDKLVTGGRDETMKENKFWKQGGGDSRSEIMEEDATAKAKS